MPRTRKRTRNRQRQTQRNPRKHKAQKHPSKNDPKETIVDPPFARSLSKGTLASPGSHKKHRCCGIDYTDDYHYQSYDNVVKFIEAVAQDSKYNEIFTFDETSDAFLDIHLKHQTITPQYLSHSEFAKHFKRGLKSPKQFVPVILNLTVSNSDNHANILVVNKRTHQIELFEPHGARTSSSELGGVQSAYKKKIKILRKFFKPLAKDFKVVNVTDAVKQTAFQMTEDPKGHTGFCVTWSILYFHYRILNPSVSLGPLVRHIHHKITENHILRYARYIEQLVKFDRKV